LPRIDPPSLGCTTIGATRHYDPAVVGGATSRRRFLGVAGAAAATALLPPARAGGLDLLGSVSAAFRAQVPLPPTGVDAPFDHVVLLMMENRSFDHLLGWVPGANGRQHGLKYKTRDGKSHPTFDLGTDYHACKYRDPLHSWQAGQIHLHDGAGDGFLRTTFNNDFFPIGYYTRTALPILGGLATHYTVLDNYFSALLAATWPNRFYQHAAATDVDESGTWPGGPPGTPGNSQSAIQTAIWDRLAAAGLTGRYYHDSQPFTACFASRKYDAISKPFEEFLADAKAGELPDVAFVDPNMDDPAEAVGSSNDYHPRGSIRAGEGFLQSVYEAVRKSPNWDRTVLVINFDEWGGFYDHVVPPKVMDDSVNPFPGEHPDYTQLGFRVPCVVISPYAPRRVFSGGAPFEHCSVLRMIEWRWGLEPMTARDANARNLAEVLDLSAARKPARLRHVKGLTARACPAR
jgi:phospholipase C